MPQRTLYRITETEAKPTSYLSFEHEDIMPNEVCTVVDVSTVTLEELADFCDREAESRNNHDYIGTHRILAAFLHRCLGRDTSTMLLLEIARYGGLDAMSGVGRTRSAFAEFGIQDCWYKWTLEGK